MDGFDTAWSKKFEKVNVVTELPQELKEWSPKFKECQMIEITFSKVQNL